MGTQYGCSQCSTELVKRAADCGLSLFQSEIRLQRNIAESCAMRLHVLLPLPIPMPLHGSQQRCIEEDRRTSRLTQHIRTDQ
jgi:hypothetical protein